MVNERGILAAAGAAGRSSGVEAAARRGRAARVALAKMTLKDAAVSFARLTASRRAARGHAAQPPEPSVHRVGGARGNGKECCAEVEGIPR